MLQNKMFWYSIVLGGIGGWFFILSGLLYPFQNDLLHKIWLVILILWVGGHPFELLIAMPIGKKAGLSTQRIVCKTLLMGVSWWIPLKLGVFKD